MIQRLEPISSGGTATVYEGLDTDLHRKVAIKVLKAQLAADPKVAKRFLEEGRKMAALSHPNILPIYSVQEFDGQPSLVMELADGTVHDLTRSGRCTPESLVDLFTQVLMGLEALERAGLYHRDVKPSNILRVGAAFKLGDLGVARGGKDDPTMLAATPRYLAPEVLAGMTGLAAGPDLYSLGCVAYELLLGEAGFDELVANTLYSGSEKQAQKPVDARSINWLAWQVNPKDLPPPGELDARVPPGLSALIHGLVRKDPTRRIGTFAEALDMLSRWREQPTPEFHAEEELPQSAAAPTVGIVRAGKLPAKAPELKLPPRPPSAKVEAEEDASRKKKRMLLIVVGVVVWLFVLMGFVLMGGDDDEKGEAQLHVSVGSTPPGASVTLVADAKFLGKTPLTLNVPVGAELVVALAGFAEERWQPTATKLETHFVLEALAPPEPLPEPPPAPMPPEPPPAVDAAALAARLNSVGRPYITVMLRAHEAHMPDRAMRGDIKIGTDMQLLVESAEPASLLLIGITNQGVIRFYPHLATGDLRLEANKELTVPLEPMDGDHEHLTISPPEGREWIFAFVTAVPMVIPPFDGAVPLGQPDRDGKNVDRWVYYPHPVPDASTPAVAFIEWLHGYLESPTNRWGRAVFEYQVAPPTRR